MMVNGIK